MDTWKIVYIAGALLMLALAVRGRRPKSDLAGALIIAAWPLTLPLCIVMAVRARRG